MKSRRVMYVRMVYIYIYIHIHTYTRTYILTYIHAHIHTYKYPWLLGDAPRSCLQLRVKAAYCGQSWQQVLLPESTCKADASNRNFSEFLIKNCQVQNEMHTQRDTATGTAAAAAACNSGPQRLHTYILVLRQADSRNQGL